MSTDLKYVKNLFVQLTSLDSTERKSLLERECSDDADLKRRVQLLLAAYDRPDEFLVPTKPFSQTLDFDGENEPLPIFELNESKDCQCPQISSTLKTSSSS